MTNYIKVDGLVYTPNMVRQLRKDRDELIQRLNAITTDAKHDGGEQHWKKKYDDLLLKYAKLANKTDDIHRARNRGR